jgi:hypothetical protein
MKNNTEFFTAADAPVYFLAVSFITGAGAA